MSTLYLVRHAQASFLSDDYDRLSPLGHEQSKRLGAYCAGRNLRFDRAIVGPRRRHRETAERVAESYQAAGLEFPSLELMPGLDEFQADAMVTHSVGTLSNRYAHLRHLHEAFKAAEDSHTRHRGFQKFMEALTLLWAREEFDAPGLDPWPKFCSRVGAALDELCAGAASGSRIIVFTSGGPAAVAVQKALALSPEKTLELIWMLRNTALVEFLFSGPRFTLSAFNALPHLEPDLWTYR